jgi:hypothetical protein
MNTMINLIKKPLQKLPCSHYWEFYSELEDHYSVNKIKVFICKKCLMYMAHTNNFPTPPTYTNESS